MSIQFIDAEAMEKMSGPDEKDEDQQREDAWIDFEDEETGTY